MELDHRRQLELANTAMEVIEKLLPHLPDRGLFHPASYAQDFLGWSQPEVSQIARCHHQLYRIATHHLHYFNEVEKGYYYELTETGRKAKAKGGHIAYQQYLADKEIIDNKRLLRKDNIEEVDYKMKRWTYQARYYPYIVSGIALIGSIVSLCFSIAASRQKLTPPDLQQVQQLTQRLKAVEKKLHSILQEKILP